MNRTIHFRFLSLLFATVIYFATSLSPTFVYGEIVQYRLEGQTQATFQNQFFDSVDFIVDVSIDSNATDLDNSPGRGVFWGADVRLSVPTLDIFEALSTNVTGILQESFPNNTRFRLIEEGNVFGQAAIGVDFNGLDGILDPNVIGPLVEPTPSPTSAGAGLPWQLENQPDIVFNAVLGVSLSNVAAAATAVPEPGSSILIGLGSVGFLLRRRRR